MIAGQAPAVLIAIGAALLLGAVIQSVVGIGLGLVSAPITTLLAPQLMPGLVISLALVLPCLTLISQHHDIDWRGLGWSLPLRVVGTAIGVWVVAAFSDQALGVTVGLMVLLAVVLTWRAVTVPVNPGTLATAGLVSGITGTATSIGGPPFALLYQHRPAAQIRSTMAIYFVVGAAMSLTGLAWSGELTRDQLVLVLLFVPLILLGVLLAVPLRRALPIGVVRPAVLLVSGASALALVLRSLAG